MLAKRVPMPEQPAQQRACNFDEVALGYSEADAAAEALKKKGHGLILQNHGMCAYGPTIESAYGLALTMEWCAQVQWHCMAAGKMNVLTDEQMEVAMEHYKTYGQKKSDGSHTGGYSVV